MSIKLRVTKSVTSSEAELRRQVVLPNVGQSYWGRKLLALHSASLHDRRRRLVEAEPQLVIRQVTGIFIWKTVDIVRQATEARTNASKGGRGKKSTSSVTVHAVHRHELLVGQKAGVAAAERVAVRPVALAAVLLSK